MIRVASHAAAEILVKNLHKRCLVEGSPPMNWQILGQDAQATAPKIFTNPAPVLPQAPVVPAGVMANALPQAPVIDFAQTVMPKAALTNEPLANAPVVDFSIVNAALNGGEVSNGAASSSTSALVEPGTPSTTASGPPSENS